MNNTTQKKTDTNSKNIKRYLRESLIGPSKFDPTAYLEDEDDIISQYLDPAPIGSFDIPRSQSLADYTDNRPTSNLLQNNFEAPKMIAHTNSQASPTLLTSQIGLNLQGTDLVQFVKGSHFTAGKGSPEAKSAKLNITKNVQEERLRTQSELVTSQSIPTGQGSGSRRIGDVEIEVKGNSTNGLIFNYVLHHSELNGFAGKGGFGRVLINSYLDMEKLRSDDISRYSPGPSLSPKKNRANNEKIKSALLPVKKSFFGFRKKKNKEEKKENNEDVLDIQRSSSVFQEGLIENYSPYESVEANKNQLEVKKKKNMSNKSPEKIDIKPEVFENNVRPLSLDIRKKEPSSGNSFINSFVQNVNKRSSSHESPLVLQVVPKLKRMTIEYEDLQEETKTITSEIMEDNTFNMLDIEDRRRMDEDQSNKSPDEKRDANKESESNHRSSQEDVSGSSEEEQQQEHKEEENIKENLEEAKVNLTPQDLQDSDPSGSEVSENPNDASSAQSARNKESESPESPARMLLESPKKLKQEDFSLKQRDENNVVGNVESEYKKNSLDQKDDLINFENNKLNLKTESEHSKSFESKPKQGIEEELSLAETVVEHKESLISISEANFQNKEALNPEFEVDLDEKESESDSESIENGSEISSPDKNDTSLQQSHSEAGRSSKINTITEGVDEIAPSGKTELKTNSETDISPKPKEEPSIPVKEVAEIKQAKNEFSLTALQQKYHYNASEDKKNQDSTPPSAATPQTRSIKTRLGITSSSFANRPPEQALLLIDPLDHFNEVDELENQSDPSINLKDKMIVTHNPHASSYKLDLAKINACQGLAEYFYNSKNKDTEKYQATVIKLAPPDFLFIGTASSQVLIFDHNQNLKQKLKYTPLSSNPAAVTALDSLAEEAVFPSLVVGFANGHICVYELKNFNLLKSISNVQSGKILCIRMLKAEPIQFAASDETGDLVRYRVQKSLWSYSEEHRSLVTGDTKTLDIQIMSKEMRVKLASSLQQEADLRCIYALAKGEKVSVIDTRDSVLVEGGKSLFMMRRREYVPDISTPSIAWGMTSANKIEKTTLLAIGWGAAIDLVKFSYEEAKPNFEYFAHIVINQPFVQHITWISEDVLEVISIDGVLLLAHIDTFRKGKFQSPEQADLEEKEQEKNISENESEIYSCMLGDQPKETFSFMTIKQVNQIFYGGSVSTYALTRETIFLGENSAYKIRTINPLEYLDGLYKNDEWIKFLTIGQLVYNVKVKELAIPQNATKRREIMLPFFRDKIFQAFEKEFKAKDKDQSYCKKLILSAIDFLTDIQDTQFLFDDVEKQIIEAGMQDIFLKYLEPFMVSGKIDYVPELRLRTLAINFCRKQKRSSIQKLLENLDLSKQDSFKIVHLCLECGLFKALIDICSKMNENCVTPLSKLLNEYQSAQLNDDETEAQEYGYRCLWYIKLCMNNQLSVHLKDKAERDERWKMIIFQLMTILFDPKNLKALFEIDGELTMCFMLLFFIGNLGQFLEERYGAFVVSSAFEYSSDDIHLQIYQALKVSANFWTADKQNQYMQYLGFFHGKLAQQLRYAFLDRELCVKFAKMFVNEPSLLNDKVLMLWEKVRLEHEGKTQEQIKTYFETKVTNTFVFSQRSAIIRDLLLYCEYSLSKEEIAELVKKAKDSGLVEIECMLLTINHQYKQCFEVHLSSRAPPEIRERVFAWITRTIRAYYEKFEKTELEEKEIEDLKQSIVDKLSTLVSMDMERTKEIIGEFLGKKMGHVLRKLRLEPQCQLEVLEKYISKHPKPENIDQELFVLHIYLLAQGNKIQKQRIKKVIQSSNLYPVEACIEICQFSRIKDACAYLESRQGNILKAIDITFEAAEDTIKKYFRKENFNFERKKEKILYRIHALLEYLEYLNKKQESGLWFDMLIKLDTLIEQAIDKLKNKNVDKKRIKEYEKMNDEIADHILDNVIGGFHSKDIAQILDPKNTKIPPKLKAKMTTKIISDCAHENFILETCESLVHNDIYIVQNLQLVPNSLRGANCSSTCQACSKRFSDHDRILWFGCSHFFHASETCCPQGRCSLCQSSSIILSKRRHNHYLPQFQDRDRYQGEQDMKMFRTSEERKQDKQKDKIAKFQRFNKEKTKTQKEIHGAFDKYLGI